MAAPDARPFAVFGVGGLYAALVAVVCLWPQHLDASAGALVSAVLTAVPGLTYDALEFGANVLMFVPLGVLGMVLVRRRAVALVAVPIIGLAVSALLEDAQASFLPGRNGNSGDIIANTLGTVLGCLLVVGIGAASRSSIAAFSRVARMRAAEAYLAPGALLHGRGVAGSSSGV